MRRSASRARSSVGCGALCAMGMLTIAGSGRALGDQAIATQTSAPILLNRLMRENTGFKTLPPWPKSMVKRGDEHHAMREIYVGEFAVDVYEASDGLVVLKDQPYDELVHVVHGECILTPDGGKPQRFKAGDIFIVPRGFSGSWEGKGGFRELIVVETQAYKRALGEFFPTDSH